MGEECKHLEPAWSLGFCSDIETCLLPVFAARQPGSGFAARCGVCISSHVSAACHVPSGVAQPWVLDRLPPLRGRSCRQRRSGIAHSLPWGRLSRKTRASWADRKSELKFSAGRLREERMPGEDAGVCGTT